MKNLFAFFTLSHNLPANMWFSERLHALTGEIVSEIYPTENPNLTLGAYSFCSLDRAPSENDSLSFSQINGLCVLAAGNISRPVNVKQSHGFANNDLVQIAPKVVQLLVDVGPDFISTLDGSCIYMAWDHASHTLHVGKDPFNSMSIYWIALAQGILVSTDIRFISLMSEQSLRLSQRGLASWLSGYPNPAISLFENVEVLPIGDRLAFSRDLIPTQVTFWDIDPDKKIRFSRQDEYSEQFRELLGNSVKVACQTDKQIVVSQMSGGLDSTSVTSLAKSLSTKQVVPLSHLYTQAEKCNETDLISDMLAFLDLEESLNMPVDDLDNRHFMSLYPTALESPGTVLSPRYVKELALVKARGADVLLSGNGGDEMCWGHSIAYTQRFKSGDLSVVPEVLQACKSMGMSRKQAIKHLFIKPFLPDVVLALMGRKKESDLSAAFPVWLTPKAEELARFETQIKNPFNYKNDPVGFNRYQSIKTTATYNAVRSYQQLSQAYGVDVRHPFFNAKLAEFTFAIPEKQLIRGAYPKWLLRNAMDKALPSSVCWNIKKITFDQHFGNLVRENADDIRQLLQNERLAEMDLINQPRLIAEFERVVSDKNYPLHVDLLYAILTFSWLKTHFPE